MIIKPIISKKRTARFTNSVFLILLLTALVFSTISTPLSLFSNEPIISEANAQQQLPQPTFAPPFPLGSGSDDQSHAHVAASGNNVHVSWTSMEGNGVSSSIYYARSNDGGVSFSDPVPITDNSAFSFLNAIAVSGNNVYIVWTSVTFESKILLAKSTNGGLSFEGPVDVSGVVAQGANTRSPAISVSGDNVYVVWVDLSGGTSTLETEIYSAASTDGGTTFSAPQDVSNIPSTMSKDPSVAASGGNVYLIWTECTTAGINCTAVFASSIDSGTSFSPSKIIANPEVQHVPDIAVIGNTVYVVFGQITINEQQQKQLHAYLITSSDGGASFSTPVLIGSSIPDIVETNPHIDVSENNIGITWEKRDISSTTPHWEVFFTGSTDNGATFSSPISLSSSSLQPEPDSTLNEVAISGSNVYSVWNARISGTDDVFFTSGQISSQPPPPPPDTSNPQINSVTIAPTTLGPGESNSAINLTATDNVGIQYAQAQVFDRNTGGSIYQSDVIPMQLLEGNAQNGEWAGYFAFPSDLADGQYIVRVLVSDGVNGEISNHDNPQIGMIIVTLQRGIAPVLAPAEYLQQLISHAQSLGVNTGSLHQAINLVSDNDPNNDGAVCNQLDAFIIQVNTSQQQQQRGQQQITPEQANQLIQLAQAGKTAIGCP